MIRLLIEEHVTLIQKLVSCVVIECRCLNLRPMGHGAEIARVQAGPRKTVH